MLLFFYSATTAKSRNMNNGIGYNFIWVIINYDY